MNTLLILYHLAFELGVVHGRRFLDVGSGCGVLVAAAAVLVGSTGTSVGIDCKDGAVQLGRANVEALAGSSREFAVAAGAISFRVHNVFVPSHDLRVKSPKAVPRCDSTHMFDILFDTLKICR